jgi:flagellar biosynthesis/type III secretory pathway M-ring protein FliF/YscJ
LLTELSPNEKIKLTTDQIRALQEVIGKDLPGFSFNKVRIMDTQRLGFNLQKILARTSVDFFSSDNAKMYEKKMSELEFTQRLQDLVNSWREGHITKEQIMKSVVEEIMLKPNLKN